VKKKSYGKKRQRSLKKLHQELIKLCPGAHVVSVFHLSAAIYSQHHYYLTSDAMILKKRKAIKQLYGILISNSLHECQELQASSKSKSPWEFYL
jgi:hypothetical protein